MQCQRYVYPVFMCMYVCFVVTFAGGFATVWKVYSQYEGKHFAAKVHDTQRSTNGKKEIAYNREMDVLKKIGCDIYLCIHCFFFLFSLLCAKHRIVRLQLLVCHNFVSKNNN